MWPREAFARFWSTIAGSCSSRSAVIVHDPAASRPHDLDDPFFERKVQEGIGRAIAEAALSGARTSNKLERPRLIGPGKEAKPSSVAARR
jgi:hypothetical protein